MENTTLWGVDGIEGQELDAMDETRLIERNLICIL